MAKKPANSGKQWTANDKSSLKSLAKKNTPTRVIGIKLKRTAAAIQKKAGELDLSLKPTNQRPYGRKS